MIGNTTHSDSFINITIITLTAKQVLIHVALPVCHHVSTIGHRFSPTISWYQCHASALIGSPTAHQNKVHTQHFVSEHTLNIHTHKSNLSKHLLFSFFSVIGRESLSS